VHFFQSIDTLFLPRHPKRVQLGFAVIQRLPTSIRPDQARSFLFIIAFCQFGITLFLSIQNMCSWA
jgi:hypothetical protein